MLLHGGCTRELMKLFVREHLMLFEKLYDASECVWFAVKEISAKPGNIGSMIWPSGAGF